MIKLLSNNNNYYTCHEEGGERRRPRAGLRVLFSNALAV